MADEREIARYRHWYRKLLGCYSQAHREQFGESMEQTFSDLCRERMQAGKGLLGFVLWTFLETATAITREKVTSMMKQNKNIAWIAVGTVILLMIPLLGNIYVAGWNWSAFDFAVWGAIVFGAGLTFELVSRKGGTLTYRLAVGVACLVGFMLVWVNGAVGIIGDEDAANAMYGVVLIAGFVGAFLVRFEARGMSRVLVVTAVLQALVPVIALAWVPEQRFAPGIAPVMMLNGVFVAGWLASALLFRQAASPTAIAA